MMEIGPVLPLVFVVIVNYDNYELTMNCVESVLSSEYSNIKVVVVDNGSPSCDFQRFDQLNSEKCIFIKSDTNGGFSAGSNIGIRYSIDNGADYVLLLNNDTEISPQMISVLVLNADCMTITVPKIYYKNNDNKVWYAGGDIDYNRVDAIHYGINRKDEGFDQTMLCGFFSGCCALISTKAFKDVGLLPEEYFMYFEDVDYSMKVAKKGYSIKYCPNAVMWHDVGGTTGLESKLSIYYQTRNRLLIAKKFHFCLTARLYVFCWAVGLGIRGITKKSNDLIRFKAISDFRKGLIGKSE